MSQVEQGIRLAFNKVRDELDDHLDTINSNSEEIKSLYGFLIGLEQKIDKLADHIDELRTSQTSTKQYPRLTLREQETFLLIYTQNEPVSLAYLVEQLGFTEETILTLLHQLMDKNIPLLEQKSEDKRFYSLELRFKELQAKQNIVHIDEQVSRFVIEEKVLK